jgi:hypothetical protein
MKKIIIFSIVIINFCLTFNESLAKVDTVFNVISIENFSDKVLYTDTIVEPIASRVWDLNIKKHIDEPIDFKKTVFLDLIDFNETIRESTEKVDYVFHGKVDFSESKMFGFVQFNSISLQIKKP